MARELRVNVVLECVLDGEGVQEIGRVEGPQVTLEPPAEAGLFVGSTYFDAAYHKLMAQHKARQGQQPQAQMEVGS